MRASLALQAVFLALLLALAPAAQAQEGAPAGPLAALISALSAACRQKDTQFAQYLTEENAAAFRGLPERDRLEVLKHLVLVDEPGRPLMSNDLQGRTELRCEGPGATVIFRFSAERVHENLAFIPVAVASGESTQFGMVREGGSWRMLSLGLLLLDIPELEKQWAAQDVEAREKAAIRVLEALAEAIQTYRTGFGALPESLAQLGPAPKNEVSPDAAQLVDAEMATGKKDGYVFRYRILPGENGAPPKFELAATPADYGKTGRRSFFLDADGKLHGADKQGAVATRDDPAIELGKSD